MFFKSQILALAIGGIATGSVAMLDQDLGAKADLIFNMPTGQVQPLPEHDLYFRRLDADALLDAPVMDAQSRYVGTVSELVVAETGRITALVIVARASVLFGSKQVVLEADEIQVFADDTATYLVRSLPSRDTVQDRPVFTPAL